MSCAQAARPVLEELEPRILYSADLAALVMASADASLTNEFRVQHTGDAVATQGSSEIAFIDMSVPDAQALVTGLLAERDGGRAIEIVRIEAGDDGIGLIGETLAQRQGVAAIHLLSHGSDGIVHLGATQLDAASLLQRAGELAAWSSALSADADVLIYGCDVAASAAGRELVESLAALSGADVAASDDATGSAARGGDWQLEQRSGPIAAASAVALPLQQAWGGLLGNDLQINTTTQNDQHTGALDRGSQQAVAHDAAGNFVVVWSSENETDVDYDVFARRFAADGTPLTGEIQVNSTAARDQQHARVESDAAGNFVVVWASDQQDGDKSGVYLRRFGADGSALTGEIRASVSTSGDQANPVLGMNPNDGSFVVAWEGNGPGDSAGIFFRRFAADGTALDGTDRPANLVDNGKQDNPALAIDGSGRFVITFDVQNHTYFQRFGADGSAQGSAVQADVYAGKSSGSAVAMDSAGNFTVVYQEGTLLPGVWGRGFNADGSSRTLPFYVAGADAQSPSIDINDDGRFIVTYQQTGSSGQDIHARKYNADGSAAAVAFVVNQSTASDQTSPSLALVDMDRYVVVWSGNGPGDAQGVSARIFDTPGAALPNVAPLIGSNGGGASASVTLAEGGLTVTTVSATDADVPAQTLSYSIIGGADAAQFAIDTYSGSLSFLAAPDYEAPADAGADRRYELIVQASDGALTDTQALSVNITNVDEAPVSAGGLVSGLRDTAIIFTWADLRVSDVDSSIGASTAVRIESLPADGNLQLFNGSAWVGVAMSQVVTKAQVDAGSLRFLPGSGEVGYDALGASGAGPGRQDYAQFSFRPVQATLHPVVNPGAQSDVRAEGGYQNPATGWTTSGADAGMQNPATSLYASDHDNLLYVNAGATLAQTLGSSFSASRQYSLAFEAGWRGDGGYPTEPGFVATLWAGSTLVGSIDESAVASVQGAFVSAVLSVDGAAFGAANGQALQIRFTGTASQAHIDNLVLSSFDPATALGSAATMVIDIVPPQAAPAITSNGGAASASIPVAENTLAVTTVQASDTDLPAQTLSYRIVGGADAASFVIDPVGGVLRFALAPNFEAPQDGGGDNRYVVSVQASDGTLADSQTITVMVFDANEFAVGAVSDTDAAANAVAENAGVGTSVGIDVLAIDADSSNNTVSYSLADTLGGRFAVDASSGVVYVAGALDFEAAAAHTITVLATSADGSSSQAVFTVNVLDADENGVGAVSDADASANAVAENGAIGSGVGLVARASDPDLGDTVSYSLVDSAGARFAIDANTGVVTLNALLDAEAAASHTVIVRAGSSDGSFNTQAFTIVVQDVNDSAVGAVTDIDAAGNSVSEGALAGTEVGVAARASDADATNNNVRYSLDGSAGGRFVIDAVSGVVTLARSIQEEGNAVHTIEVRATSADNSFSTKAFDITVGFVNDHAPVIGSDGGGASATVAVDERQTAITMVQAADADLPAASLVYRIGGGADAVHFAIDPASGALSFVVAADAEAPADADRDNVYLVTVQASDGARVDTQALRVQVSDVNEFAVGGLDDSDAAVNGVSETAAAGTQVGLTAFGQDGDASDNRLAFTLDNSAGGRFAIDAASGVVTLARAIAEEGLAAHTVTVRAISADGSMSTQGFVIAVRLGNDQAPVIVSDGGGASAALTLDEGQSAVTTVRATDADMPATSLGFTITGGADAALFRIDVRTGALEFTSPPDRERALDADGNGRYEVVVGVSDGALSAEQALSITVANVDEAPVIVSNTLVLSGQGVALVLRAADPDSSAAALVYAVTSTSGGRFELNTTPGTPLLQFSQADIDAGRVIFVADVNGAPPSYTLALNDGVNQIAVGAPQLQSAYAAAPTAPVAAFAVDVTPSELIESAPAAAGPGEPVASEEPAGRTPAAAPAAQADALHGAGSAEGAVAASETPPQRAATAGVAGAVSGSAGSVLRGAAPTEAKDAWYGAVAALALPSDQTVLPDARPAFELFNSTGSTTLAQALDRLREQLASDPPGEVMTVATTALMSTGLSVGYVLWLARGGVLVASLMSSVPAWASVDPLPVLAQMRRAEDRTAEDDAEADASESDPIERLFSRARRLLTRPAETPQATPPATAFAAADAHKNLQDCA